MFQFHRASIRLTATTLLVVFLSALLGPVAALASARQQHLVGAHLHLAGLPQAHHHHDEDDEDDHDHHAAALAGHAPKSHHSHKTCTGDDEQQLTSVDPLLKLLDAAYHGAPAVLTLPPVLSSFVFRPYQAWDRQQAVVLVPPEHLKPKIPDLRIFIGSLVI